MLIEREASCEKAVVWFARVFRPLCSLGAWRKFAVKLTQGIQAASLKEKRTTIGVLLSLLLSTRL